MIEYFTLNIKEVFTLTNSFKKVVSVILLATTVSAAISLSGCNSFTETSNTPKLSGSELSSLTAGIPTSMNIHPTENDNSSERSSTPSTSSIVDSESSLISSSSSVVDSESSLTFSSLPIRIKEEDSNQEVSESTDISTEVSTHVPEVIAKKDSTADLPNSSKMANQPQPSQPTQQSYSSAQVSGYGNEESYETASTHEVPAEPKKLFWEENFQEVDYYVHIPEGTPAQAKGDFNECISFVLPESNVHVIAEKSDINVFAIQWYESKAYIQPADYTKVEKQLSYNMTGAQIYDSIHSYKTDGLYESFGRMTDSFETEYDGTIPKDSIVQIKDLGQSEGNYVIRNGIGFQFVPKEKIEKLDKSVTFDFAQTERWGFTPSDASPMLVKDHEYDLEATHGYAQVIEDTYVSFENREYKVFVPKGTICTAHESETNDTMYAISWYAHHSFSDGEVQIPATDVRFLANQDFDMWAEPSMGMMFDRWILPPGDIFHQEDKLQWAVTSDDACIFLDNGKDLPLEKGTYIKVYGDFIQSDSLYFVRWHCSDGRNKGLISKEDVQLLGDLTAEEEEKILQGKTAGVIDDN